MKTLFTLGESRDEGNTLVMEIASDHCCYGWLNAGEKEFESVSFISLEEQEGEEDISAILDEIHLTPSRVIVGAAYVQALLVPQQFHAPDYVFNQLVFDLPSQKYFRDHIAEWQMVNGYSIPEKIYQQIISRFPGANFMHVYTPSLKLFNGFTATDQVELHFSIQQFRVVVRKDQKVQLAQTYTYKTPLDVVYYMLKICYEFGLDQSSVFMIVSGLVDRDSAMYHEIHHYFLNLHFSNEPEFRLPQSEYPHHYFHSLYNLAACVS